MKTRTLLLLAVGCGLAILLASGILLFRLTTVEQQKLAGVGELVRVGDMDVTVERVSEQPGVVLVDVSLGGVDDDDGAAAFRLVVPGQVIAADPDAGNHCGATTVQVQPCTLAFRLDDDAGSTRVLLYQRGDERVRWDLVST